MMPHWNVLNVCRSVVVVLFTGLLFFLQVAELSAAGDKNSGLLWEVNRPGAEPAYLFGTIHSEDPEVLQLAQPVQSAIDRSDTVVLEILLDTEAMMYSSVAMLMQDGRVLSEITGQPLFKQAALAIQTRGIPDVMLERMKPWAAAMVLSMPGSKTGQVLDMMLYQDALQQGKVVHGLETIEEQLNVFESLSETQQVTLLRDAVEHFSELDAMHAELLQAYKQRDLAGLMALSEASMEAGDRQLAEDFQQSLIVDRNYRMADRMQPYLQQGKAFIAVGALHLPGEEGLLNLLEQQGYTVRRLY